MRKLWLLALGIMLGSFAQAQGLEGCGAAIEQALRTFGAQSPIEGELVAAQCKAWPPSADKVVAAVMAFRVADDSEVRRNWDVPAVVALVDARTGRVLHGRRFTIGEDAATYVGSESLVIDTANYALSPSVRALGLRFHNDARRPGAPDAWWNDELTLLVPSGKLLVPMFCQAMSVQQAESGAVSYRSSGAVWKDAQLTLAIGARNASRWNDLIVTENLSRKGADDAKFDPTSRSTRYVYRNDGLGYRPPKQPRPFWLDYRCSMWD